MAKWPWGREVFREGSGFCAVAVAIVAFVLVSGLAVSGVIGQAVNSGKPVPGLENPVTVSKTDGDVTRTWVSPGDGYFHQWIENSGLKGIEIYVYDVASKPPIVCSYSLIDFQIAGAYPTGTVQLGYFEMVGGHTYMWDLAPSGRAGTSARYFWSFEEKSVQPVASFRTWYSGTILCADASSSYDPDGTIVQYAWDWMDGTTSTGVTSIHQYAAWGGHTVKLTVTDDDGLSSSTVMSTPPPPPLVIYGFTLGANAVPVPGCSVTASNLRTGASLTTASDGTGYYQLDFNMVAGGWKVGDVVEVRAVLGSLSGSAQAILTSPSMPFIWMDVVLQGTPNAPPVANISAWYVGTAIYVDASASYDPDGVIVEYLWDWRDGNTSTGVTSSHQYASHTGGHTIYLTVTDDDGMTALAYKSLPPPYPFMVCGFLTDQSGAYVTNCPVTVTCLRTGASVSTASDGVYGWYELDFNTVPGGWETGDVIEIVASNGVLSASAQVVLSNPNVPYVEVDLVLS